MGNKHLDDVAWPPSVSGSSPLELLSDIAISSKTSPEGGYPSGQMVLVASRSGGKSEYGISPPKGHTPIIPPDIVSMLTGEQKPYMHSSNLTAENRLLLNGIQARFKEGMESLHSQEGELLEPIIEFDSLAYYERLRRKQGIEAQEVLLVGGGVGFPENSLRDTIRHLERFYAPAEEKMVSTWNNMAMVTARSPGKSSHQDIPSTLEFRKATKSKYLRKKGKRKGKRKRLVQRGR